MAAEAIAIIYPPKTTPEGKKLLVLKECIFSLGFTIIINLPNKREIPNKARISINYQDRISLPIKDFNMFAP